MSHSLMNTKSAAAFLCLSTQTLERMRLTGSGPVFIKLGRGRGAKVVYSLGDLDAWLQENRHSSTSEYGRS